MALTCTIGMLDTKDKVLKLLQQMAKATKLKQNRTLTKNKQNVQPCNEIKASWPYWHHIQHIAFRPCSSYAASIKCPWMKQNCSKIPQMKSEHFKMRILLDVWKQLYFSWGCQCYLVQLVKPAQYIIQDLAINHLPLVSIVLTDKGQIMGPSHSLQ